MSIIHLTSLDNPALKAYTTLTEAQLRNRLDEENGIFIAESPKVIRVAMNAGYRPLSMLCEERHISGDAAFIIEAFPEIDVFTGSRELLTSLTGYKLTRGVLCAMKRRPLPSVAEICMSTDDNNLKSTVTEEFYPKRRIAVIDGVVDTTNIGAIFRSAAALGIDGILLTPTSCDPLNRRAVRVSMGTIFQVPWTWIREPLTYLHNYGFKTVAMALSDDSVPIDDPTLCTEKRLAIVLGTEGDGLSDGVISSCDYVARIPMAHGVDSLNVAAASAVAFWQLRL
ncbi:MAG: RNA methyltransferase [Muribaculaceae bacterium]|nr:RNA methyltransferase [Muribaculaceae bacterium]